MIIKLRVHQFKWNRVPNHALLFLWTFEQEIKQEETSKIKKINAVEEKEGRGKRMENWDKFHLTFFVCSVHDEGSKWSKTSSCMLRIHGFFSINSKKYRNGNGMRNGNVKKIFLKIKSTKLTEIKGKLRLLVEPFMRSVVVWGLVLREAFVRRGRTKKDWFMKRNWIFLADSNKYFSEYIFQQSQNKLKFSFQNFRRKSSTLSQPNFSFSP